MVKPEKRVEGCVQYFSGYYKEIPVMSLVFNLPGVKKESIELTVNRKHLSLRADRGDLVYTSDMNFICDLIPGMVNGQYENGVLTVHLREQCPEEIQGGLEVNIR